MAIYSIIVIAGSLMILQATVLEANPQYYHYHGHDYHNHHYHDDDVGRSISSGSSSNDLCSPNPCGRNAICRPGYDNTGKDRPVCTCPAGYIGNALVSCNPGECVSDHDCPSHRVCSFESVCIDPCRNACGVNANCEVRNHRPVCSCPRGYLGHPFSQCYREPTRGKRKTTDEAEEKST